MVPLPSKLLPRDTWDGLATLVDRNNPSLLQSQIHYHFFKCKLHCILRSCSLFKLKKVIIQLFLCSLKPCNISQFEKTIKEHLSFMLSNDKWWGNDTPLTRIIAVSVQKTLWPMPQLVLRPEYWFWKIIYSHSCTSQVQWSITNAALWSLTFEAAERCSQPLYSARCLMLLASHRKKPTGKEEKKKKKVRVEKKLDGKFCATHFCISLNWVSQFTVYESPFFVGCTVQHWLLEWSDMIFLYWYGQAIYSGNIQRSLNPVALTEAVVTTEE